MKQALLDVLLWILAAPALLVRALIRGYRQARFLKLATVARIVCHCGAAVYLVGLWRCSCGYTYRGHLLRACPVCSTIPVMVRCYRCGVTTKLPEAP